MPVLERMTFIAGRSPAQVLDFCLEGANFPKIFPERISPLRGVDINDLRISAGCQFSFRHRMWGVIPATWTVVICKYRPGDLSGAGRRTCGMAAGQCLHARIFGFRHRTLLRLLG